MERTKKVRRRIEYSVVEYISDIYNGEQLDTKVIVNEQFLCCIAGNTVTAFHAELTELINKYKI